MRTPHPWSHESKSQRHEPPAHTTPSSKQCSVKYDYSAAVQLYKLALASKTSIVWQMGNSPINQGANRFTNTKAMFTSLWSLSACPLHALSVYFLSAGRVPELLSWFVTHIDLSLQSKLIFSISEESYDYFSEVTVSHGCPLLSGDFRPARLVAMTTRKTHPVHH